MINAVRITAQAVVSFLILHAFAFSMPHRNRPDPLCRERLLLAGVADKSTRSFVSSDRYLIVGAGPAGLAMARRFKEFNIPYEQVERDPTVGGMWRRRQPGDPKTAAYPHLVMNSSKKMSAFPDFPMPAEWPDFPTLEQAGIYLESFADHFGLTEKIKFETPIIRARPIADGEGSWRVLLPWHEERTYTGLIITSGGHEVPRRPDWEGKHPTSVKLVLGKDHEDLSIYHGKRVVVEGGGNSGADILAKISENASETFWSLRRGAHLVPDRINIPLIANNVPADQFAAEGPQVPLWVEMPFFKLIIRYTVGTAQSLGLKKPDHDPLGELPVVARGELIDALKSKRARVIDGIDRVEGADVFLKDGTVIQNVDIVVSAIGYERKIPYIADQFLNWYDGGPGFYWHVAHPNLQNNPAYDKVFLAGMLETTAGGWPSYDDQAQLVAAYLHARMFNHKAAEAFDAQKKLPVADAELRGELFSRPNTARNRYAVDFKRYRKLLLEAAARLRKEP